MEPPLSHNGFQSAAALAFFGYTIGVFVLAYLSHRLLRKRAFLSEYYLGSRGLGLWALAMSYAATSASGGSFTGFPSLIYEHGWILALWIASYMIVPVCAMGLLGKRLNHVARKSGALTVPDIFRDRFETPALGVLASLFLVFFLAFNLVAQFKAGAVIIETLIGDLPGFGAAAEYLGWVPERFSVLGGVDPTPKYCLSLLIFAGAVTAYTAYGGFRAVAWTDVLQGIVMFAGILLLLGFTLSKVEGGLEGASRSLARTASAAATLRAREAIEWSEGFTVIAREGDREWRFATARPLVLKAGETRTLTLRSETEPAGEIPPSASFAITADGGPTGAVALESFRFDPRRNLVGVPGFSAVRPEGFLPLALAFSYFVMWAISGAGQPTTMLRLMAFRDTKTYRYAMFSVSIYYALIYIPLVLIFVCARNILPQLANPDRVMPVLVMTVIPGILAGLVLAAPFAAVMSTVDSFLLAISSSVVRDIYQRTLRPDAPPHILRRLSYLTTLLAGVAVLLGALNPPRFLQHIIVLTGGGFACTFLAPTFFSLYWKRMNAAGAGAGMAGGFGSFLLLYILGWLGITGPPGVLDQYPGGFLPLVWGLAASTILCLACSWASARPPAELVERYFKVPRGR